MRKKYLRKEWIIIFLSIFIFSALALALDEDRTVRVQGVIMDLDIQKKVIVVNEKMFIWNQNTIFHNEQGNPIKNIERLKLNTWVYIEGEYGSIQNYFLAKKIYFLAKYIDEKERNSFPFVKMNKRS